MIFTVWMMLYGMTYELSERLSAIVKIQHIVTVPSMLLYWSVFFRYMNKNNYAVALYICIPQNKKRSRYFVYLPLLLMTIVNFDIFIKEAHPVGTVINMKSAFTWLAALLIMISSVIGEEVVFRGVLLSILMKYFPVRRMNAIIVSSFIFAGMHILNLLSGKTLDYVLMQILNAGAVGFCLAVVSCLECSIVPGIVIHSLINVSSLCIDGWEAGVTGADRNIAFMILPILYLLYGGYLYRKGKNGNKI